MLSRTDRIVQAVGAKPMELIHFVLALPLLLIGLYLDSPFYQITAGESVLAQAFDSPAGRVIVSILYILPALMMLWAQWKDNKRLKELATFGLFLGYLFSSLLRVLVSGFFPLLWLFTLGLGVIAAIAHLHLKSGVTD